MGKAFSMGKKKCPTTMVWYRSVREKRPRGCRERMGDESGENEGRNEVCFKGWTHKNLKTMRW
jgi:hypothetical protein